AFTQVMYRTQNVTRQDSRLETDSSSWAYGWHGGIMYQVASKTRAGLAYHSKFVHHTKGQTSFVVGGGGFATPRTIESDTFQATLSLPALTALSLSHELTPAWHLLGTVDYTQWSV